MDSVHHHDLGSLAWLSKDFGGPSLVAKSLSHPSAVIMTTAEEDFDVDQARVIFPTYCFVVIMELIIFNECGIKIWVFINTDPFLFSNNVPTMVSFKHD